MDKITIVVGVGNEWVLDEEFLRIVTKRTVSTRFALRGTVIIPAVGSISSPVTRCALTLNRTNFAKDIATAARETQNTETEILVGATGLEFLNVNLEARD